MQALLSTEEPTGVKLAMVTEEQIAKEIHSNVGILVERVRGVSWVKLPEVTLASKKGNSGDLAMLKLSLLSRKGIELPRLSLGVSTKRGKSVAVIHSTVKRIWGERRHPCLLVLDPDIKNIRLVHGEILKDYSLTKFAAEIVMKANQER